MSLAPEETVEKIILNADLARECDNLLNNKYASKSTLNSCYGIQGYTPPNTQRFADRDELTKNIYKYI